MRPCAFEEATVILRKPPAMEDEECGALSIARGTYAGKYGVVISAWKPTDEELEQLQDGGVIYLHVISGTMPPVMLSTDIEVEVDPE